MATCPRSSMEKLCMTDTPPADPKESGKGLRGGFEVERSSVLQVHQRRSGHGSSTGLSGSIFREFSDAGAVQAGARAGLLAE